MPTYVFLFTRACRSNILQQEVYGDSGQEVKVYKWVAGLRDSMSDSKLDRLDSREGIEELRAGKNKGRRDDQPISLDVRLVSADDKKRVVQLGHSGIDRLDVLRYLMR